MRFISKLFAKKVNPIEEKEVFVKCGECSLSQQQYPHAPFYYEEMDTSKILCESCYEMKTSHGSCSCVTYNEATGEFDEAPECYGDCGESLEAGHYFFYWKRLEKPVLDYSKEPQVSGFILEHPRTGYDRVYFGPFKTMGEISEWMNTVGYHNRVSPAVYPIMNPHGDPADFWYIGNDVSHEEMLKPKGEREYLP